MRRKILLSSFWVVLALSSVSMVAAQRSGDVRASSTVSSGRGGENLSRGVSSTRQKSNEKQRSQDVASPSASFQIMPRANNSTSSSTGRGSNSNASVVERNRPSSSKSSNSTKPTYTGNRTGGERGGNKIQDNPSRYYPEHGSHNQHHSGSLHRDNPHNMPPQPHYSPNAKPPHGYHVVPPPHGRGCPHNYRFDTPPPPRAPYYTVGGVVYYFYDCCFHVLVNGVYQIVAAPYGLSLLTLPDGCETIVFKNRFYYYYDGTFFRNYGTHYEVIAPSIGMIVPYLPNYGVSYVCYKNRPAYYFNGYYYYEVPIYGGVAYKVVGKY